MSILPRFLHQVLPRLATLAVAGGTVLALAAPAWSAPAKGLPALLAIARHHNPDLEAARLRYESAQSRAGYAGALEPPRLNLSMMQFWGLQGPSAAITQMVPLGQKRRLEADMAGREAEAARAEYEAKWLSVASEVKQAYYELVYLEKAMAIHHATRDQVKNLQRVANARYAVGSATQQDSLRAQVELSKLYDSEFDIAQRMQSAESRLNSLLNRPAETPVELPRDFPQEAPRPAAPQAQAQAEANSPMLRAAEASLAVQEARSTLAAEERQIPDLEVGLEAGQTMPDGMNPAMNYFGGMVEISLPWLTPGRNQGRVAEADRSTAAARASLDAQRTSLRHRVRDLAYQLERTDQRLQLYRKGLFSQVNQSLKAALVAYQVNKSDFGTVIDAQVAVFDTQIAFAEAQYDYFRLMAQLEAELNLPDPESKSREK